jgi:hypothetical protein
MLAVLPFRKIKSIEKLWKILKILSIPKDLREEWEGLVGRIYVQNEPSAPRLGLLFL